MEHAAALAVEQLDAARPLLLIVRCAAAAADHTRATDPLSPRALLQLSVIAVSASSALYTWIWLRPQAFVKLCARAGADPCTVSDARWGARDA